MTRRLFVKATALFGALSALPMSLSAKKRTNQAAFKATSVDAAIKALYGTSSTVSGNVSIKVPKIAENGGAVPVTVSSDGADVKSIILLVEGNPRPLVSILNITKNGVATMSTRIKLAKTSNIVAVAKIGNKLHKISENVVVTIGGCGG